MAQVLIVENEPEESLILGTIVEQAGHEVDFAFGGEEALKKIDLKRSIDVVITDLDMPKGHGLKLIMTLRTLYPEVGIIAVSATGPEQLAMAVAVEPDSRHASRGTRCRDTPLGTRVLPRQGRHGCRDHLAE